MCCNKNYGISAKKIIHGDQQQILTHFKIIEMSIAVRKQFPYIPYSAASTQCLSHECLICLVEKTKKNVLEPSAMNVLK